MDLESLEESLIGVSLWSLMVIFCLFLVCALLAATSFVLFVLLKALTAIFAYSDNDMWEYLETKIQSANHKSLLSIVNLMAKFQTSEREMKEQLRYLERKKKLVAEANELVQREAYLAEEIVLRHRGNDLALHSATLPVFDHHKKELRDLPPKLHENWKNLKRLTFECPGGAWIRDYARRRPVTKQGNDSLACAGRGGCCAFGCGCCENIRAFGDVPKERPVIYFYSHCTIECACCHRRELRAFCTQEKNLI